MGPADHEKLWSAPRKLTDGPLKLEVRADLDPARAGESIAVGGSASLTEARACNPQISNREGRMVGRIQEFALQEEPHRFANRNRLVDREVEVVPAGSPDGWP